MVYFRHNLPGWERAMRVVAGILLIGLAIVFSASQSVMWGGLAVGVVLVGTGLVGFCPICAMVGRRPVTDNK